LRRKKQVKKKQPITAMVEAKPLKEKRKLIATLLLLLAISHTKISENEKATAVQYGIKAIK
jgi:hypothetical protein